MKKKRLNYFLDDDRYMIKSREGQKNSFFVPMGGREGMGGEMHLAFSNEIHKIVVKAFFTY